MSTWLEQTREKLRDAPRWLTLSQIAAEADLQVSWLSAFAADKITDPGVTKVQRLHDYLCLVPTERRPERIKFDEHKDYPTHQLAGGVYIIWSDKTCVYVGTSHKMFKRLRDHARDERIMKHNPTHVDLIYAEGDAHALEMVKIKALKPVVNVRGK